MNLKDLIAKFKIHKEYFQFYLLFFKLISTINSSSNFIARAE